MDFCTSQRSSSKNDKSFGFQNIKDELINPSMVAWWPDWLYPYLSKWLSHVFSAFLVLMFSLSDLDFVSSSIFYTFLCSFFVCKTEIIMVPTPQGCWEDKNELLHEKYLKRCLTHSKCSKKWAIIIMPNLLLPPLCSSFKLHWHLPICPRWKLTLFLITLSSSPCHI